MSSWTERLVAKTKEARPGTLARPDLLHRTSSPYPGKDKHAECCYVFWLPNRNFFKEVTSLKKNMDSFFKNIQFAGHQAPGIVYGLCFREKMRFSFRGGVVLLLFSFYCGLNHPIPWAWVWSPARDTSSPTHISLTHLLHTLAAATASICMHAHIQTYIHDLGNICLFPASMLFLMSDSGLMASVEACHGKITSGQEYNVQFPLFWYAMAFAMWFRSQNGASMLSEETTESQSKGHRLCHRHWACKVWEGDRRINWESTISSWLAWKSHVLP